MFQQAVQRLFLILFPIVLFLTALCLSHIRPTKQDLTLQKNKIKSCPFFLGVSFFSKTTDFQAGRLISYTLNESDFIKKIQDLKLYFQKENIALKQIFFAFPLILTKGGDWIISQKTFFILPTGERKQISHLTYSEINTLHKKWNKDYKALRLSFIFSYLPKKSNFLFYLLGSDRNKIINNLKKIQNKTNGNLYLSSSNEKLLKDLLLYQSCSNSKKPSQDNLKQNKEECLSEAANRINLPVKNLSQPLKTNTKILHSFKSFIRLEMLSILPQTFKQLSGHGIIIPDNLSPSQEISNFLKKENKLLFFKKDPPYTKQDQYWIQNSQAFISSKLKLAIRSIKAEKTCFIKN